MNAKAIATGDYEGYKKTVSADSLKQMDAQTKEMKGQWVNGVRGQWGQA